MSAMIQLHYHPSDASLMPHILLEELGVPFALLLVDRSCNAQKSPQYLQLNPNGLIPVLQDGSLVLYETPAILMHLADTHPQSQLLPPLGSHARAHAHKWLVWLSNTSWCSISMPSGMCRAVALPIFGRVRRHGSRRCSTKSKHNCRPVVDRGCWARTTVPPTAWLLCCVAGRVTWHIRQASVRPSVPI